MNMIVCEFDLTEQTTGERICKALMPLIAVVEMLIFTVANCFNYRPSSIVQNQKCGYTAKDLARLAEETRCTFVPFFPFKWLQFKFRC